MTSPDDVREILIAQGETPQRVDAYLGTPADAPKRKGRRTRDDEPADEG